MDANINRIHSQLDTIEKRYDPENDLASPRVSWTEYELSIMVRSLAFIVVKLEERIESLECKNQNHSTQPTASILGSIKTDKKSKSSAENRKKAEGQSMINDNEYAAAKAWKDNHDPVKKLEEENVKLREALRNIHKVFEAGKCGDEPEADYRMDYIAMEALDNEQN